MFPGVTNIASMNLDEIGRLYESAMWLIWIKDFNEKN
jgi:hypothetical protein